MDRINLGRFCAVLLTAVASSWQFSACGQLTQEAQVLNLGLEQGSSSGRIPARPVSIEMAAPVQLPQTENMPAAEQHNASKLTATENDARSAAPQVFKSPTAPHHRPTRLPLFAEQADIVLWPKIGLLAKLDSADTPTTPQAEVQNPAELAASESAIMPQDNSASDQNSDSTETNEDESESGDQLDDDYTSEQEYDKATNDAVARKQEYGERRTDNTRAFLRAQTPLLKPRQWQFDYGLTYSILETDFPVLLPPGPVVGPDPVLTNELVKFRTADALLGFRYGITERLQWAGSTTVGWQGTEFANGFFHRKTDASGIGDIATGLNYLLFAETECSPSVITSVNMTAPTGNPRSPRILTDSGTGLGAWTFASDVLMVKAYDPLVLFWGAGYRWFLEDTFHGERVKIGDSIQYNLGTGFGVNERVTLSCALLGAYDLDTRLNSVRLRGTGGDAISVRLAATILKDCKIVEPFVNFGLTQRVPEAFLGVIWTR